MALLRNQITLFPLTGNWNVGKPHQQVSAKIEQRQTAMAWITHEGFPHEHGMKGGDEVEVGCKAACQETATLNELMQLRKPSPEICNTKIS